jgi:S1-C subfamily serine protease
VAKRVRGERLFGYVGLGLFGLFPLVSVLQLRDPDAVWRTAADRTRGSVVALHESAGGHVAIGCGVVIQDEPLRIVTCSTSSNELMSPRGSGWIHWRSLHVDPHGSFALLEAVNPPPDVELEALPSPPVAAHPNLQRVDAALVPPSALDSAPLWVGTLRPESDRTTYRAAELRPVSVPGTAVAASDVAPGLLGAPFVSREGAVVAVLARRDAGGTVAIPIETIASALQELEQQATRRGERMP